MLHEIIVDPGNFHKVFYCIVFGQLIGRGRKLTATKNSNKIVILAGYRRERGLLQKDEGWDFRA